MQKRIGSSFVVALMLFCLPAVAQLVPDSNTYGTASEVATSIPDFEFNPFNSSVTFGWLGGRYVTGASGALMAGVHLPAGASITRVEAEACNTNATQPGSLLLEAVNSCCFFGVQLASLDIVANTGCTVSSVTVSPPVTVNNATNSYYLQWQNLGAGDGTVTLRTARVYYKLQVSLPPGTATFTDVPTTHLFFQYVEALAAAGITAGCGGGNFCPDAAVTRGQMAVFLAKALGLQWAP